MFIDFLILFHVGQSVSYIIHLFCFKHEVFERQFKLNNSLWDNIFDVVVFPDLAR